MTQNRSVVLKPPRVSLIIPAHARNSAFDRCVAAVCRLDPPPFEVIVVADGPAASGCTAALPPGIRARQTDHRRGPAAARNIGAQAATSEVLFFVDADVVLPMNAVAKIQTIMISPDPPDAVIGSYDTAPAEPNFLSQYKNLAHHYVHQHARRRAHTFWGACGAITRRVFWEIGGFDEQYDQPCIEDIELGLRLTARGYTILLAKSLQVTHLKRWTPSGLFLTDFFCRALPWSRLILASRRMDDDLNTTWAARLKVGLCYLLLSLLVSTLFAPAAGLGAAVTALALLLADGRLLRFFVQQRGWFFAARVPLWQWLYYAYSGLAFGWVVVESMFRPLRSSPRPIEPDIAPHTGHAP